MNTKFATSSATIVFIAIFTLIANCTMPECLVDKDCYQNDNRDCVRMCKENRCFALAAPRGYCGCNSGEVLFKGHCVVIPEWYSFPEPDQNKKVSDGGLSETID